MTKEEFDELTNQLRKQGLTDDDIMSILYETYSTNQCDLEDYEAMVGWLGYSLSEEFYKAHGINKDNKEKK